MGNEPKNLYQQDSNGYYIYDVAQTHLEQNYNDYTEDDHKVWQILFERQMKNLPNKVTKEYLKGIDIVGFENNKVPNLTKVNQFLAATTGWEIHVVPGLIPVKEFFELMQNKKFCATTWLRTLEQLDYLEEPDMFHDVFGHVPLLTNQPLCDFVQDLSTLALKYIDNTAVIEAIGRLYWFTIEFGLIQERQGLRIYGAGIVSSSGETDYSLFSTEPQRVPFNATEILRTPYYKDHYQNKYFVIYSFEQLYNSMSEIEAEVEKIAQESLLAV